MKNLQTFLNDEFEIGLECKGRGRGFELTYEGTLSKRKGNILEKISSTVFSVGNTLDEIVINLTKNKFSLLSEDTLLKKYMKKGWNIDLTITGDSFTAFAKKVWSENNKEKNEEKRYGKSDSLASLVDFMFENYDENHPYVQEKTKEMIVFKKSLHT